jgi:hypothetical protein
MSYGAIAASMAAEGCTAAQIAAAVAAMENAQAQAREARRAKLREGEAERQRRRRERNRLDASRRDSTGPLSALSPKKETPLGTPKEKTTPIPPFPGEGAPAPETRLPADFEPTADDRAFGQAEGLTEAEIDRTLGDLRLWAAETGGAKAMRADWHAAFRRFMRRDADAKRSKAPPTANGPTGSGSTTGFYIKRETPEGEAWWAHMRRTTGKTPPADRNGGWTFPSPWPPDAGPDKAAGRALH